MRRSENFGVLGFFFFFLPPTPTTVRRERKKKTASGIILCCSLSVLPALSAQYHTDSHKKDSKTLSNFQIQIFKDGFFAKSHFVLANRPTLLSTVVFHSSLGRTRDRI